jgi:hypothetical protein
MELGRGIGRLLRKGLPAVGFAKPVIVLRGSTLWGADQPSAEARGPIACHEGAGIMIARG